MAAVLALAAVASSAAGGCGDDGCPDGAGDAGPDWGGEAEAGEDSGGEAADEAGEEAPEAEGDAGDADAPDAEDDAGDAEAEGGVGVEGLHAAGGFLRDILGRAVFLRGILWPHLAWTWAAGSTTPFTSDYVERLRGWGFNHLRVYFRWAFLEPEPGVIDEAYLAALEDVVTVAEEGGLYVVVELDQNGWAPCFPRESDRCDTDDDCADGVCEGGVCQPFHRGNGVPQWLCEGRYPATFEGKYRMIEEFWTGAPDPVDPATTMQERMAAMWVRVAARLADHPRLGYAPLNEPPTGLMDTATFEDRWLYPYWTRLAAAIRAADPEPAFFYPPYWALYTATEWAPAAIPNRVYSVHFYPPDPRGPGFGGTAGCAAFPRSVADIEAELALGADAARARGEPLWVGEWGACTGTPAGDWLDVRTYAEIVTLELDARMASHSFFALTADDWFGILDSRGEEKPDLLRSLDRVYPPFVAGTPLGFSFDVTSRLFLLYFLQEPGIGGDTVVYVPQRHFSGGFEVLSTDPAGAWSWEFDEASRRLRLRADPRTSLHMVAVQPAGGILADECATAADCGGIDCHPLEPFGIDLCAEECTDAAGCPPGETCAGLKAAELFGGVGYCVRACATDGDCAPGWSCRRFGPAQMCRRGA
jgi:endoglycosylceramidase